MGRGLVIVNVKMLNVGLNWLLGFLEYCCSERKKQPFLREEKRLLRLEPVKHE